MIVGQDVAGRMEDKAGTRFNLLTRRSINQAGQQSSRKQNKNEQM
jgi:hypothetical protein